MTRKFDRYAKADPAAPARAVLTALCDLHGGGRVEDEPDGGASPRFRVTTAAGEVYSVLYVNGAWSRMNWSGRWVPFTLTELEYLLTVR